MTDKAKAPKPGAVDEHSGLRTGGVETIAGGNQDPPKPAGDQAAPDAETARPRKR